MKPNYQFYFDKQVPYSFGQSGAPDVELHVLDWAQ